MSSTQSAEVVVIGGGIFGCAVAWELARQGMRDVVVLERENLGTQTTSRAASVLTTVTSQPAKSALFQETWSAMSALEEELDDSLNIHEVGTLHIGASKATAKSLDEHLSFAASIGEVAEELSAEEARARVKWLGIEDSARCVFLPRAGYVDSYRLATAYGAAAKARGVDFRVGVEVLGVSTRSGSVSGVETSDGFIESPWVVNCAGPWAGILSAELGWHLPMAPVRSQYWITETRAEFDAQQPMVFLPDVPAYARGEVGGLLFGLRGGPSPARDPRALPRDLSELQFEEDPSGWETLAVAGESFARFCPLMESVGVSHYVSGPSSYTPDGNFILGACPGVDGYLVASGCCGSGIAASGGVGRALAELITKGESSFDLEIFRPDRFGQIDAFDEAWLERCSATRSTKNVC
ncbi:MAG: FAD-binding oxidoreductase [Planctomycetota bacterium]|nr:FAD-binding oxidoreductase [Planctomycetota bacterium]